PASRPRRAARISPPTPANRVAAARAGARGRRSRRGPAWRRALVQWSSPEMVWRRRPCGVLRAALAQSSAWGNARRCSRTRSSVGVGETGREFRDHLLQLRLVAGLVGFDEGGNPFLERIRFGCLLLLLQLGDLGADRCDLLGLLLGRQLVVGLNLHQVLVGFEDA